MTKCNCPDCQVFPKGEKKRGWHFLIASFDYWFPFVFWIAIFAYVIAMIGIIIAIIGITFGWWKG